ncbi:MAG TPA: hypothetical protein H9686_00845 [Firmicutes bacterium]|nr:hypothetical protein [Bacillota bacterium]
MTQRKSIGAKLFIALIALTLISCCFLGSTFARYTSGGKGSASTGVAKWSIDVTGGGAEGSMDVDFTNKLSPSMDNFAGESAGQERTNSTGKILIATINNEGDVTAKVTITAGAITITETGEYAKDGTGITKDNASNDGVAPTEDQVKALFDIKLYQDDSAKYTDGTEIGGEITLPATNGVVYIFAEITWTSADTQGKAVADAIDTWVGENVTEISYTFSYTAVQASEIPAGN